MLIVGTDQHMVTQQAFEPLADHDWIWKWFIFGPGTLVEACRVKQMMNHVSLACLLLNKFEGSTDFWTNLVHHAFCCIVNSIIMHAAFFISRHNFITILILIIIIIMIIVIIRIIIIIIITLIMMVIIIRWSRIAMWRCHSFSCITTMPIARPNKSGTCCIRANERNRGANIWPGK